MQTVTPADPVIPDDASALGPASHRVQRRPSWALRWSPAAGEILLAVLTALGFTYWGLSVDNNPVSRVGQISGLSTLQFRLAAVALVIIAVVVWTTLRCGEQVRRLTARLSAAAVAGLATGYLGAGQVFALRGTPWPLNAEYGDNNRLLAWAGEVVHTGKIDTFYPPGIPYALGYAAKAGFLGGEPAFGLKWLFIALVALTGPAAYLAWRLCLRPLPALAVGLLPALQQTLPHKPYSPLVLVVLVPLIAKLLLWLRASPAFSARGALVRGAFLGLLFGGLFLVYSGWHLWSLPGVVVAVLLLFPYRRGPVRGLLLLGGSLAGFLAVAGVYLKVLLGATATRDLWCSGLTMTEPGYMGTTPLTNRAWDEPGEWPGMGEFAGLPTYTVVVLVGLGVAVALGLRKAVVIAPLACFASAWFIRFWIAGHMEANQEVQLFPRTILEIQVALTALAVLACVLAAEHLGRLFTAVRSSAPEAVEGLARARRFTAAGTLLAMVLAGGMIGSFFTNQYLPTPPADQLAGSLAWNSHQIRKPDGQCPKYANGGLCRDFPKTIGVNQADFAQTSLVCEYPWHQQNALLALMKP
ncbi:hypothetical protein [Kitasatospora sp. McL0602]|uniref:hypothetical protein n=1 Tax=Kitasatospora sp. McL0602 TaxID=3439530 RepID=UPI003F8A3BD3